MWVKPAAGMIVRDHRTKRLVPETGLDLPEHDLAFVRLVQDGDLIECGPPAPEPDLNPEPITETDTVLEPAADIAVTNNLAADEKAPA